MFKIYKGKKVFLTGHTGFKGCWLALWLKSLGAEVLGYSLSPNTTPSFFGAVKLENEIKSVLGNILDKEKLEKTMQEFNPDIIFHLAAQPLVRLSYAEPLLTYQTNVIGTLNVLEASRKCTNIKAFVNVTTDKCYENKEVDRGYTENEPMGGWDMYSSSKGCVEIMSSSYRRSFLKDGKPFAMATARAGNVIGGGDWAQDRLIPDCIKFINTDRPIEVRNPIAIRPWQHVLEPLSGYLLLGQKLIESQATKDSAKYTDGFNFGPNPDSILTVADVVQRVINYYQKGEIIINQKDDLHEANLLMLNIDKAKQILNWVPTYSADEAIQSTVEWYKRFYKGNIDEKFKTTEMLDFSLNQIKNYENRMEDKEVKIETVTGKFS